MIRPLAILCLAGAALFAAVATAQAPVSDEVPAALLDKIRTAVASEANVSAADVKVVSAKAVNWPNGALGCPKPGVMYTQAIVPGYRVELEASGRRFTYNASAKGAFKRCDNRLGGGMTPKSVQ